MARRNKVPQVPRPRGKGRLIELGKDVLIVALACSALFLAGQTPMVNELRGWMAEPVQTNQPQSRQPEEALEPYLLAVRNERGLYGVAYDEDLVGKAFQLTASLLGEGLATAGTAEKITEGRWRTLLEMPGIYCAFQGRPPLAALSAWLGGGPETLAGGAQAALLAWDGSNVWLCWRDGGDYQAARTQVAWTGHLEDVLDEFNPNGAGFAYALAESDGTYAVLDPYVMVSMATPQPIVYSASSPDFVGDAEALDQLLGYLGFQSGGDSAYMTAEGLTISEGTGRLRVSQTGTVVYHAGEDGGYPVASTGSEPTCEEAALAAWDLANQAMSGWKGEGALVLTGAEARAEGWVVSFHYRLDGLPVLVGGSGWAAQFLVKGNEITDFTLNLRSYSNSGATSVVPRELLAAAALGALDGQGGRLTLCYSDANAATVTAGWVAESP